MTRRNKGKKSWLSIKYPKAKKKKLSLVDKGWTSIKGGSFGSEVKVIYPEWEVLFGVKTKPEWEQRKALGNYPKSLKPESYPAYLYVSGSRYEFRY